MDLLKSTQKTMDFMQKADEEGMAELLASMNLRRIQDVDLSPYFSEDQLNSMCELESTRLKNMVLNHEFLKKLGLRNVKKPDFMLPDWDKAPSPPPSNSEGSDVEWTPEIEDLEKPQKAKKALQKWQRPLRRFRKKRQKKKAKPTSTVSQSNSKRKPDSRQEDQEDEQMMIDPCEHKEANFEGFTEEDAWKSMVHAGWARQWYLENPDEEMLSETEREEAERNQPNEMSDTVETPNCLAVNEKRETPNSHRYPRRDIPKIDYAEVEIPDEDYFIYCHDCGDEFLGDCPLHPLKIVKDTETEPGDPDKASHTCPPCLRVHTSKIEDAGDGIWSTKFISKDTRFGPYAGVKLAKERDVEAHESGYCWLIFRNGKPYFYIDGQHVHLSNWMRYVNSARHLDEQNVIAYQFRRGIYYKTIKDISPDCELLVWYGADYAKELGILMSDESQENLAEILTSRSGENGEEGEDEEEKEEGRSPTKRTRRSTSESLLVPTTVTVNFPKQAEEDVASQDEKKEKSTDCDSA